MKDQQTFILKLFMYIKQRFINLNTGQINIAEQL